MLGWEIIIYREQGHGGSENEHKIADWTTGLSGTDWLDSLVKAGLAQKTESNCGYPWVYVGRAQDILPHLTSQPTPHKGPSIIGDDYFMPTGWKGQINIKGNLVAECLKSNEQITIHAWDQS